MTTWPAGTWHAGLQEILDNIEAGRTEQDDRYPIRHGSMRVGIYAPRGRDEQTPHDQDELYIVVAGTGTFERGSERIPFAPGTLLFVPAEMPHRFTGFGDDFSTWVVFWGPKGGER
jgi:mannose-6-phosphate isomerase-like protein (cupin superfamily)